MSPINFRPTRFFMSENARKEIRKMHDDYLLPLALETLRRNPSVTTPLKQETFGQKIKNLFRTKSSLSVMLDKEKNGDFFLTTSRKINDLNFVGKNVPVEMNEIVKNPSLVDSYILQSKEGILEQLSAFNNNKKLFRL